jgi:CheY-like chemotaxis protein
MNERTMEKFQVLVADDSENDRLLLRAAMRRAARMQIAAEVSNGEEAISFLGRCVEAPGPAGLALPDLLLLDLKMPVQDGFAVLEWLRPRKQGAMTVVVLTQSMQPDHICRALDMGADFFQVKPRTQKECVSMVLALEERLVNGLRTAVPSQTSVTMARYHQMA